MNHLRQPLTLSNRNVNLSSDFNSNSLRNLRMTTAFNNNLSSENDESDDENRDYYREQVSKTVERTRQEQFEDDFEDNFEDPFEEVHVDFAFSEENVFANPVAFPFPSRFQFQEHTRQVVVERPTGPPATDWMLEALVASTEIDQHQLRNSPLYAFLTGSAHEEPPARAIPSLPIHASASRFFPQGQEEATQHTNPPSLFPFERDGRGEPSQEHEIYTVPTPVFLLTALDPVLSTHTDQTITNRSSYLPRFSNVVSELLEHHHQSGVHSISVNRSSVDTFVSEPFVGSVVVATDSIPTYPAIERVVNNMVNHEVQDQSDDTVFLVESANYFDELLHTDDTECIVLESFPVTPEIHTVDLPKSVYRRSFRSKMKSFFKKTHSKLCIKFHIS